MTKKEAIISAWMDLNIETPFGICDKTGWIHGYFCNGVDDIINDFGDITDKIDYDIEFDGVGKFRPKTLRGIEYNNGWIKIGEDGIIPYEGNIWGLTEDGKVFFFGEDEFIEKGWLTHYQPIEKPELPIYNE